MRSFSESAPPRHLLLVFGWLVLAWGTSTFAGAVAGERTASVAEGNMTPALSRSPLTTPLTMFVAVPPAYMYTRLM